MKASVQTKDMVVIGTKSVYRNKMDEAGITTRNKTRLLAKGCIHKKKE